jgi:hypothetical protein
MANGMKEEEEKKRERERKEGSREKKRKKRKKTRKGRRRKERAVFSLFLLPFSSPIGLLLGLGHAHRSLWCSGNRLLSPLYKVLWPRGSKCTEYTHKRVPTGGKRERERERERETGSPSNVGGRHRKCQRDSRGKEGRKR